MCDRLITGTDVGRIEDVNYVIEPAHRGGVHVLRSGESSSLATDG